MSKLIPIASCRDCPFWAMYENNGNGQYQGKQPLSICRAKHPMSDYPRIISFGNARNIPDWCPLPDTEEEEA